MLWTRRRHLGLTLVEVLVVISVVALLAAILMPVLGKVRRRADRLSCQSHLRQIGVACSLYAADHRGRMPRSQALWEFQLYPYYIATEDVFNCPDSLRRFEPRLHPVASGGAYTLNQAVPWGRWQPERWFRDPSNTVLVFDGLFPYAYFREPITGVPWLMERGLEYRHGKGVNVLYADRHVEWRALEDLTDNRLWTARGD